MDASFDLIPIFRKGQRPIQSKVCEDAVHDVSAQGVSGQARKRETSECVRMEVLKVSGSTLGRILNSVLDFTV